MYFCVNCASRHKEFEVFSEHETISANDQKTICPQHKDVYVYLCMTCKKSRCMFCVQNKKCKDHTLLKIVCESEKMKEVIQDLNMAVKKFGDMQNSPTDILDKEIKSVIEQKDRVSRHMERLTKKINHKGNTLLKTLTEKYEELLAKRQEILSSYKEKAALLSSLRDAGNSALKLGHDHVVSILPNIQEQMDAVMTLPADMVSESLLFRPQNSIEVGKLKLKQVGVKKKKDKDPEFARQLSEKLSQISTNENNEKNENQMIEVLPDIAVETMSTEMSEEEASIIEIEDEQEAVFWESSV